MITSLEVMERIQKNVGVPWQSQRPDGYSDGILVGSSDTVVTGVVTTYTPTLQILKRTIASGKNTIICRESPFYSRGERSPLYFREGPAPPKELIDKDAVYQAKQELISQHNLVIIRLFDNWDARSSDGQLKALTRALGWDAHHIVTDNGPETYDPRNVYFQLPATPLSALAHHLKQSLKIQAIRVIGDPKSQIRNVALVHGLLLVAEAERILNRHSVDLVVAGDAVEWEVGPYFQDLVTARMSKGLILLGDEASEEPGCGELATWLKTFITEVPIEWMPAGEPFRTLALGGPQ